MDIQDKTLFRLIAISVVVLVVVALISSVNGGSLDPRDRDIRIIVTDSMDGEPTQYPISTIPKGSLVVIQKLSRGSLPDLKVGDVLAYRSAGQIFTHRIVENDAASGIFHTKGDNAKVGEQVSYSNAVGVVIGVSKWMGDFVTFLKQAGVFLAVGIVMLTAAAYAIRRIVQWGDPPGPKTSAAGVCIPYAHQSDGREAAAESRSIPPRSDGDRGWKGNDFLKE